MIVWKEISADMDRRFAVLLGLLVLAGCNRLSDTDYKALRCELWREQGSEKRSAPYSVVLNKNYKCWRGSNRLSGMTDLCTPEREQRWINEINQACDLLLK